MTTIDSVSSKSLYSNPQYGFERAITPPISPQTQPIQNSIYTHVTIQYCRLIKQFITQMIFVKFHQRVMEQTNQILEFMTCRTCNQDQERQHDYNNIYQKILLEHITDNLPDIWDDIFSEHNIHIVFRYLVDLIHHLSVYSTNTATTDPKYTYSQQTIRKHFCTNRNHVYSRDIYLPETYIEFVRRTQPHHPSYAAYQSVEHEKEIRNSILNDVFGQIFSTNTPSTQAFSFDGKPSPEHSRTLTLSCTLMHRSGVLTVTHEQCRVFNPKPFYVYLEHYARRLKQHDGTRIFDKNGNLEITESLLHKYIQSPTATTYFELYTIGLLDMWLK